MLPLELSLLLCSSSTSHSFSPPLSTKSTQKEYTIHGRGIPTSQLNFPLKIPGIPLPPLPWIQTLASITLSSNSLPPEPGIINQTTLRPKTLFIHFPWFLLSLLSVRFSLLQKMRFAGILWWRVREAGVWTVGSFPFASPFRQGSDRQGRLLDHSPSRFSPRALVHQIHVGKVKLMSFFPWNSLSSLEICCWNWEVVLEMYRSDRDSENYAQIAVAEKSFRLEDEERDGVRLWELLFWVE